MNALMSWILVMLLFASAWLLSAKITAAMDWVLDRLWGQPSTRPSQWGDSCPCGQDREYHDRMARGL